MEQIRDAINTVYKEGKFSTDKQAETFNKIQPKRKSSIIPSVVTVFVTACLLIGLNMLLFQNGFEDVFQSNSTTSIQSGEYPEFSGKALDYNVLKKPWMFAGLVAVFISLCYALFSLKKKWLVRMVLCVITMMVILASMYGHREYSYYVKDDTDILNTANLVFTFGGGQLLDTMTIEQYRIGYFSREDEYMETEDSYSLGGQTQGIAIFKNDGKGYEADHFIQSRPDRMHSIHLTDIRQVIMPLFEGHSIEKLIVQVDDERIEVAVDSNAAQLVAVPYKTQAEGPSISIQTVDREGNVLDVYEESDVFTYPDVFPQ
ncbi:MAG: hypothetical protein RR651_15515 [Lysinibacillus sp.]